MRKKDKIGNSDRLLPLFESQNVKDENGDAVGTDLRVFRERMSGFSLRFRPIEPSDFFKVRRKVVLCCENYTWAPVLRSFDKLCEVRVLSYLI